MKSTKTYNNISPELKKQIPKLKNGEVVTFQMLNGTPNPDPDERERAKEPLLYGKRQLRTNFRIWDETLNEYVDVGCVDTWNGEKPDRFRMFVPGMDMGSRFQGKFSLTGGNVKDEELYEVLWLSPEREGSLFKDASIAPLFRLINLKEDSKASVNKFATLQKAISIAEKLKTDKSGARAIMAALNQPTYQDDDVLAAKIGELASGNPELLVKTYESPETAVRATIREALDKQVLDYDIPTGKIKMGGMQIAILKTDSAETFVPAFAKWLGSAENGSDVLKNIKNQIQKKQEEQVK